MAKQPTAAERKILDTAAAAAAEAKHTLAVAQEVAARLVQQDTWPISPAMEHRLTLIEAVQKTTSDNMQTQHDGVMKAINSVEVVVLKQNSRVGKLETWKTQQTAIYGALIFSAPFTFFALTKWFGS